MELYPFILEPIYVPKPWGGRALTRLRPTAPPATTSTTLPPDQPIGESWELADLDTPQRSAVTAVANGPLAGQSLRQLIDHFADQLIAPRDLTTDARFPLLIKYLDAHDALSVQTHPSPEYAAAHSGAHAKGEAWYILNAAPGAVLYKGLKPHVTTDDLRHAINHNTVPDLLNMIPAHRGDCHYLPSGTVHALGAGIVVAEIQTPSDTTFRIHDWQRTDRELHIEQALASLATGTPDTRSNEPGHLVERGSVTAEVLVRCEHFAIEKSAAPAGQPVTLNTQGRPEVLMLLEGVGTITSGSDTWTTTPIAQGQTILLPAQLPDARFEPAAHTEWLHIRLP